MKNNFAWPVLLSHLLVAFTIEVDNEWEFRYWLDADPSPVRTSLVMWANFLRFVTVEGITVQELSKKAGYPPGKQHTDLAGMLRWRYVAVDSANPKKPKMEDSVRLTPIGIEAARAWQPLVDEIENRWMERFGDDTVSRLKRVLASIIIEFDRSLPHYFPTLDHRDGMRVRVPHAPESDPPDRLALPYLLSQVHHLFSLDAERSSDISLAIRSNVLRILNIEPTEVKELPLLSGISKEAMAMSINTLIKKGLVLEEPSPSGRGKVVRLTEEGKVEKQRYPDIINTVDNAWQETISTHSYDECHSALDVFFENEARLFQGLIPPDPRVWRAQRPKRITLPHHPMVLYRGGWPDGS